MYKHHCCGRVCRQALNLSLISCTTSMLSSSDLDHTIHQYAFAAVLQSPMSFSLSQCASLNTPWRNIHAYAARQLNVKSTQNVANPAGSCSPPVLMFAVHNDGQYRDVAKVRIDADTSGQTIDKPWAYARRVEFLSPQSERIHHQNFQTGRSP